MIRVAYPVPPVRQFRLRFDLAARRTREAIGQRRRDLRSHGARSGTREFRSENYFDLRYREEVAQGRLAYQTFEERFDKLVAVLCLAAQEGVTPEREARYREQRTWFVKNYAGVKSELGRFMDTDESDTAPGMWGRRSCDAFEALFLPTTLQGMLTADNGYLIGRLMRTQNAMMAWDERLASAERAFKNAHLH